MRYIQNFSSIIRVQPALTIRIESNLCGSRPWHPGKQKQTRLLSHSQCRGRPPAELTSPSLELHLCHLDLGLNAPSHRCRGASLQRDLHRGQLPGHVVVTPGYSVQGTVAQ